MSSYKNWYEIEGEALGKRKAFDKFFNNKNTDNKDLKWLVDGKTLKKLKKVKENMSEWFFVKMLVEGKVNSNEYGEQLNKEFSIFDLYE